MDDRIAALASGILATAALFAIITLIEFVADYQLLIYRLFSGTVTIPETIGSIVFITFGIIVWPIVFMFFGQKLAPEHETMRGVILALILWMAFFIVSLPTTDAITSFLFVASSLLAHIIYGFILGFTFGTLGGEHRTWQR